MKYYIYSEPEVLDTLKYLIRKSHPVVTHCKLWMPWDSLCLITKLWVASQHNWWSPEFFSKKLNVKPVYNYIQFLEMHPKVTFSRFSYFFRAHTKFLGPKYEINRCENLLMQVIPPSWKEPIPIVFWRFLDHVLSPKISQTIWWLFLISHQQPEVVLGCLGYPQGVLKHYKDIPGCLRCFSICKMVFIGFT